MKHFSRLVVSLCVALAGFVSLSAHFAYADTELQSCANDPACRATDDRFKSVPVPSLANTQFKFDPNTLSPRDPSKGGYYGGDDEGTSDGNTVQLLRKIARLLLVIVSTGAVLFITYGGFLMAISGGDTDRSTKGRTIVTYNVQALIVAMLAYGIIQFVIWII